jgi:dTDP-4-amino-4,6-dideoxygalactose transaminase
MMSKPAVLGAAPRFPQRVDMVRPVLPDFADMEAPLREILATGMVTKGRFLRDFEGEVARHLGVAHAVAVSSCTTGLMLTYKALGLTGEVIVPSFTFMASVSSLVWAGLRPVFVDVRRETTNIDPAAVEAAITPETSAIVGVHNFGVPAEIDALEHIAQERGLKLIFDAAHGFGCRYRGQPIGKQGHGQVFSLSPTKLLIAGEGGIVATEDADVAEKVRIGREYGNSGAYDSAFAGINARMPETSAVMGLRSLRQLERAAARRNETAALFRARLEKLSGIEFQVVADGCQSSYKDLSITVDPEAFGVDRDQLGQALAAENIDTRKYYDPPVHQHTAYRHFYDGRPLPNTLALSRRSLSLPIWSAMDDSIVVGICEAIERVHQHAEAVRKAVQS